MAKFDATENDASAASRLRRRLTHYYTSDTPEGRKFRYAILAFDIVTILFIVLTSFLPRTALVEVLDAVFGLAILSDFAIRIWISRKPLREFMHPATWADMIAIVSFLAPMIGEGAGFLRVLRTVRLLRSYHLVKQLRNDFSWFRLNEEIVFAAINLFVFLFIMTAVVYETQHTANPQINNYVDALYFTVTTLTTTGFGDITLSGTTGRLIAVTIMILGVTLFLNLVRTILQPVKVRFTCPRCGLRRHDTDAVHCKACGEILNIPDDGAH